MARRRVCILSEVEAHDFQFANIPPNCRDHRHTTPRKAREMIREGWMRTESPYFHPIARVVGPHHIVVTYLWSWAVVHNGYTTLQLVNKGS